MADKLVDEAKMAEKRDELVEKARMAEQSERYDDMVNAMRTLTELDVELTEEEKNLLSVAYKNVVGSRRSAWRVLASYEEEEEADGNDVSQTVAKQYRQQIEEELSVICKEVFKLLDTHLIPKSETVESTVFYLKMKGDYYRYLAEVGDIKEIKQLIKTSNDAYQEGYTIAKTELTPTHPIRLGLVLNYSVFQYEILKDTPAACSIAKEAFESAVSGLESLSEDNFRDSSLILELLRDNLTLWTSKSNGGDENGELPSGDE